MGVNYIKNVCYTKCNGNLYMKTDKIGEIETGNSLTSIDTLADIAVALNIPIDNLFIGCNKKFLIYAIDDYLNMIDKPLAKNILDELNKFITGDC